MIINDSILGLGEIDVSIVFSDSIVDTYICGGYAVELERELTEFECELLDAEYRELIEQYAWESGRCRLHN